MNTNKKNLGIVVRAKKTFVGRIVCRLAGEENGQAMMEYVIIAVVIAAACALIMAIWGKAIFGQAKAGIEATDGRPHVAETTVETQRTTDDAGIAEAAANNDKFQTTTTKAPTPAKK